MSCQLSILSTFADIRSVKKYLFPNSKEEQQIDEDFDGWNDTEWGWKDEEEEEEETPVTDNLSSSWLQRCIVSLSPSNDVLAIASEDRVVLLVQKYDPEEKNDIQMKLTSVWQGILCQEDGEFITCLLCLPLASQKRSTHGGPDWTCVIVGFSSGYVRFYTENGTLLLSQILHVDPVLKLKCRTYTPPRHVADAEKHEELTILYPKALVTIDGFSLFQSLRACRNQVARAAASGTDLIQPPPLAYKKWGLQEQDTVTDHVSCGLATPNQFDQMQTASMIGGFSASIKSTPPAAHRYITAGFGPYVAFFYAIEGTAQPMLSDVAHAVAHKLKSAIFSAASGWFGLNKQTAEDEKKRRPKIEPATGLPLRFGLPDKRRQGESIVLSPDSRLVATTDSFGRVMLIDIERGVAVRMWKGYRDAQVGWIQVKEDIGSDHEVKDTSRPARVAMFLVIYAPRRGILEVWASQQGPRVAAFNVSKCCQLLCLSYGLMGLNNVTCKKDKSQLVQCCLIDPEGNIKGIDVPFHLALSDKNSKRARDLHLLKKLKTTLKDNTEEQASLKTEVINTLLDIKIGSIRQQGLERVLATKYLSQEFILSIVTHLISHLSQQQEDTNEKDEVEYLDTENKLLLQFCRAQSQLLDTYAKISQLHDSETTSMEQDNVSETLEKLLSLSESEIQHLSIQIENYYSTLSVKPKVTFETESSMSITEFLRCFECQLIHTSDEDNTSNLGIISKIVLHKGLSESHSLKLANYLFLPILKGTNTIQELSGVLQDSGLPPDSLLLLLLRLWLSEEKPDLELVAQFYKLLEAVCLLKGADECDCNWWKIMRDLCSESQNIGGALLASVVGRSAAIELANMQKMNASQDSKDSSKVDLNEWESVTMDTAQWNILVKQLEDVLALQCLLRLHLEGHTDAAVTDTEPVSVSVSRILAGGRGVIPELVARWIAHRGILPSMLCLAQEDESDVQEKESTKDRKDEAMDQSSQKSEIVNPVLAKLQAVQSRLPYSLDSDILMANCAWEYMVQWSKDLQVVSQFENALSYLKCINNAVVQHGVCSMMWKMFTYKPVSAAASLMEKVGKAPKERLCRRDVGLGDMAMTKMLALVTDFLDTFIQASCELQNTSSPVLRMEDLWQTGSGPTALIELAMDQPFSNPELIRHHYHLSVIMQAVMTFTMKSVKPLSLFDTKGRNAFFKEFHSHPTLPDMNVDSSIIAARRQFFCKVITHAVLTLEGSSSCPSSPKLAQSASAHSMTESTSSSPPSSPGALSSIPSSLSRHSLTIKWPALVLTVAAELGVNTDHIVRHQVCELYSAGHDKLAEEALLMVNDHAVMGSQLILIAGQRLAHFLETCDPPGSMEMLSRCSPTVSTWLKTLDHADLHNTNPPLFQTAALVGQVVNQLPEGHAEYSLAISLVEFVQAFL